jgi:hypothetical protein
VASDGLKERGKDKGKESRDKDKDVSRDKEGRSKEDRSRDKDRDSLTDDNNNNGKPSFVNIFAEAKDLEPPYLQYPLNITMTNLLYFCAAPTLTFQVSGIHDE